MSLRTWYVGIVGCCLAAAAASPSLPIPGTDPTGRTDSSHGLNAYVMSLCKGSSNYSTGSVDDAGAIVSTALAVPRDVHVDLQGGVYRMDSPLQFNSTLAPFCTGMVRVTDGTLLAGEGLRRFEPFNESFLVTVLGYWGGLGISMDRINFASNFTGGGVRVDASHHVHIVDRSVCCCKTIGCNTCA